MTLNELFNLRRILQEGLPAELKKAKQEQVGAEQTLQAAQSALAAAQSTLVQAEARLAECAQACAGIPAAEGELKYAQTVLDQRLATLHALEAALAGLEGKGGHPGQTLTPDQIRKAKQLLLAEIRKTKQGVEEAQAQAQACITRLEALRKTCAEKAQAEAACGRARKEEKLCQRGVKMQSAKLQKILAQIQDLEERLQQAQLKYQRALDRLIPDLESAMPLALLPVRLETRYVDHAQGTDLLVRVYPDEVHQDTLTRELTNAEIALGQEYWMRVWRLGTQAQERVYLDAWQAVVTRAGVRRGAWIVKQTAPINPGDRSVISVPDTQPLNPEPEFPKVNTVPHAWNRAAHTRVLPDRWVALGYQKGQRVYTVWGELIPETLPTGLDPQAAPDKHLRVDAGVRWMVDFQAAEKVGMGLRMRFASTADKTLERLMVVGVKATLDARSSAAELAELFQAHQHTWGLGFVPHNTPTNNTQDTRSGYAGNPDAEASFRLEIRDPPSLENTSAGVLAGRAFGVGRDSLVRLENAELQEQDVPMLMQAALWPATWEYYLYNMLGEDDLDFPKGVDLPGLREFYCNHVRARGVLPTLCVGTQPYGILPVTSLERWAPRKGSPEVGCLTLGADTSALSIHWDTSEKMTQWHWDTPRLVPWPKVNGARSAGVCLADVTRTGQWDWVHVGVDKSATPASERTSLGLGRNVDAVGQPRSWQWITDVPECPEVGRNEASAVTVADVDGDGEPEVVLVRFQRRTQGMQDVYACVTMGDSITADQGLVRIHHWDTSVRINSLDGEVLGAGIGVVDFSSGARPEIVLAHAVRINGLPRFFLHIGAQTNIPLRDLEALQPTGLLVSAGFHVQALHERADVYVVCVWEKDSTRKGYVFVGRESDARGKFTGGWSQVGTPWDVSNNVEHVALTVADLGRHRRNGLKDGVAGAVNVLAGLRRVWLQAVNQNRVPRIGRPGSDSDRDLLEVLGTEAVSHQVAIRDLLGRKVMEKIKQHTPIQNQAWLGLLGMDRPLIGFGTFHQHNIPVTLPWVEADTASDKTLTDNYIQWLCSALPEDIQNSAYPNPVTHQADPPQTLLYRLLRMATLWAYAGAAYRADPPVQVWQRRDPEIMTKQSLSQPDLDSPTPWTHLQKVLKQRGSVNDPELDRYYRTLKELALRPVGELEAALAETLDLSSHRLDAWITGLAAQRLQEVRKQNEDGVFLGGFGWVENLAPRSKTLIPSQGYTHAPSLGHATAAAVLRSGYLTHLGRASGEALAVDLSSRRVRLALQLMEGIRRGQPLGALLGYRYERGLHELHPGLALDKYIAEFRALYPLVAGKMIPSTAPVESIAATNVVDGLALLRFWQAHKKLVDRALHPGSKLPTSGPEYAAMVAEVEALAEITDACSDLTVAESVYQSVQGNASRAAAGLDALSRGEVPPPELEVIRTPRRGTGITHRVLAVWNAKQAIASVWNSQAPRAQGEPALNAWVAQHLCDPQNVRARVQYINVSGTLTGEQPVALAALDLCPLDVLYFPLMSRTAQQSEWETRLADWAMQHRPTGVTEDVSIHILFERDPGWAHNVLSFPEFLEAVRALREALAHTRPLQASDLANTGQVRENGWDGGELAQRAQQVFDLGDAWVKDGLAALGDGLHGEAGNVRRVLRGLSGFALGSVIPGNWGATPKEFRQLLEQLQSAVAEFVPRIERVRTPLARETDVDFALRRVEALLGAEFMVLPQIVPGDWVKELETALDLRAQAGDAPATEVGLWLQIVAPVRVNLARLETARTFCSALPNVDTDELRVAQLPATPKDRWAALPLNAGEPLLGGRVALAILETQKTQWQQPLVGLMADEWVEVVPQAKETTGLAFHFDAPGACAPQSILLAVHPDPQRRWNLETLEDILLETMDAAKLRAVDLESLQAGGQYLPALCVPFNLGNETMSTVWE